MLQVARELASSWEPGCNSGETGVKVSVTVGVSSVHQRQLPYREATRARLGGAMTSKRVSEKTNAETS